MTNDEAIEILNNMIHMTAQEWNDMIFSQFADCINAVNKAIKALKAQDKALDEWCTDCKEYDTEKHCCPRFNKVIRTALSELPSAEKRTETHACDCISRHAAIAEFSCCELTPDGGIDANYVIDFLKQLPSAQPEYKLDEWCTDCKEYDHERHCCPRFNRVIRQTLDDAQAERKTGKWEIYVISMLDGEGCRCSECGFEGAPYWDYCPNCGADMRGEPNENR